MPNITSIFSCRCGSNADSEESCFYGCHHFTARKRLKLSKSELSDMEGLQFAAEVNDLSEGCKPDLYSHLLIFYVVHLSLSPSLSHTLMHARTERVIRHIMYTFISYILILFCLFV